MALSFMASGARAAPEEIQVYLDEMDAPHELGLDIHANYVASGDGAVEYAGALASPHTLRLTPEFSLGLTPTLELGAYLPLAAVDSSGHLTADGAKARLKFLVPHANANANVTTAWWGLNLEVGRVGRALDINPWNSELKVILGHRQGRWLLATNANVDWVVSGPAPGPVTLDIDTKLAWSTTPQLQLGLESYNGLGALSHPGRLNQESQLLYLVADSHIRHWDLNIGIGRGYGGSPDRWVIKAIVGVPMQ